MSDLELLPLAALAERLPAMRGKKLNRSTVYRWATVGLLSRSGERVRLSSQFVGGTLCSTMADAEAFFAAKNGVFPRPEVARAMSAREAAQWAKRGEDARARLRRYGL